MTAYYTVGCDICEHPIKRGDLVSEDHWHHEDVNVCRENIRADERERMAGLARRVQGGGIRDYEAEVRERLREAWREEGHAVLFNLTGDDLTPAQRVGKWLGGESEWK